MNTLDKPFRLSPQTWLAATTVAILRKKVNDGRRADIRDRGEDKNLLNDLNGAAGELVFLRLLEREGATNIEHDLLNFGGPVNDVDFKAIIMGRRELFEVKCLLMSFFGAAPQKEWFLINEKAHQRSMKRGAPFYVPVLSKKYGGWAYVGKPISQAELESEAWTVRNFGEHEDPAIAQPLSVFMRPHFGKFFPAMSQELEKDVWDGKEAERLLVASAGRIFEVANERLADGIKNISAAEVVSAMLAVLKEAVPELPGGLLH